ncbi:hypothetical protein L7F22_034011 [Adiantum nelumboides]|nr:hypothetical protein [Adiantum nelumboides]
MERVTEIESNNGNGTEESEHSRWKMGIGRASRRKEKSIGHRSRTPDGHYRKDRGPDLKIACPIFKGKKHDDLDMHIQAFEQYDELKHILEEEWGEYFPHTLKEAARKWYYHYPPSKLQAYRKLKKAFILEYTDHRGDEDILCELDRIKQVKLSVKKYVQKIKELTRRLNEPPFEKRMRAWFPSGFNSRKPREQEALVNEALVSNLEDLENRENDDEEEKDEDKEDPAGTSSHPRPDDDDNNDDDQGFPGTGPSSRGASNEPPPTSQPEPSVSKGTIPEQTHATGTAGEKTTEEFVKELDLQPGQRVLDIGCGIGGGDFYMAEDFDVKNHVKDRAQRMMKWVKRDGYIFFRESCFHQSGDHKRKNNPTHYRPPSFYLKVFQESLVLEDDDSYSGLQLISCKCVNAYVLNKRNQNQICWLWQKVKSSGPLDNDFQRFLDTSQHKMNGILRYEWIFGEGFVSIGGKDSEKEDAYLNMSLKQEENGNVCETANEFLSDSVPQESVCIVDEAQELVVVMDKSQEEPDAIVSEPKHELDFLNHMVCASRSQKTMRLIKKKK